MRAVTKPSSTRPLLLAFIVALFALAIRQCEAQRTRTNVYRRATARGAGVSDAIYEAVFTSAEEDLMKAKQHDEAHIIAGFLPDKSAHQVARKCVEMGLKCGDAVAPPERNSEQWRNLPRRH